MALSPDPEVVRLAGRLKDAALAALRERGRPLDVAAIDRRLGLRDADLTRAALDALVASGEVIRWNFDGKYVASQRQSASGISEPTSQDAREGP